MYLDWSLSVTKMHRSLIFILFFACSITWEQSTFAYTQSELREQETSKEEKIRELRDQEINQLRIALGRRIAKNRRADLYYRLSELYLEAYRTAFLLEGRVHEAKIASGKSDRRLDRSYSKPYLSKGIQAAEEVLKLKIPFQRMDAIYYFLGFYYEELGQKKSSERYYSKLVSSYPKSKFAVGAYNSLGEYAFNANQFKTAKLYFEKTLHAPQNEFSTLAIPKVYHRLAWCQYRLKNMSAAISTLKKAISVAQENDEKFLGLKEEALRDMAIFMAESGQVSKALDYFDSIGQGKAFYPKALESLGKEYERNAKTAKAVTVYDTLLKTDPDTELKYNTLTKIIDLDLRLGRYTDALARTKNFQDVSSSIKELVAYQNAKAMIRRTATESHDQYRKKKDKKKLQIAFQFYEAYLNVFLQDSSLEKERSEIQMYLAEVYKGRGEAKQAARLYKNVIETKDKRYAKEAAAFWVGSLAEALKNTKDNSKEISPPESEFIKAADELESLLPESKESIEASLRAAQILAGYGESKSDAIKRLNKIMDRYPSSSQANVAALLYIQLYSEKLPDPQKVKQDDYEDAVDDLKDALNDIKEKKSLLVADSKYGSKLNTQMHELERRLSVGKIAVFEKNNDFSAAADAYENFIKGQEGKKLSKQEQQALFNAYENAIRSYLKANQITAVMSLSNRWFARYPKENALNAYFKNVGTELLVIGEYKNSIQIFRNLGIRGNDADSLETAARIAEGVSDDQEALALIQAMIRIYKPININYYYLWAGKAYLRHSKSEDAAKLFGACAHRASEEQAECASHLGDIYLQHKDYSKAKTAYQFATVKNKKTTSVYSGYAQYKLAEIEELEMNRKLEFTSLQMPATQLKKAISERMSYLEKLSKIYLKVVQFGGPWGVASLYRLAKWVNEFAIDVENIKPLNSAKDDELKKFKSSLEAFSTPLKKRAIESWKSAYEKSVRYEILSPFLPEIHDQLSNANVKGFHYAQGLKGRYQYAGKIISKNEDEKGYKDLIEKLLNKPKDSNLWLDLGNYTLGDRQPLLADLFYERALSLNSKNASALNNKAVLQLQEDEQENWDSVARAKAYLDKATDKNSFLMIAKQNKAILLNYYKVFDRSENLWEQILSQKADVISHYGVAVALTGAGKNQTAQIHFNKIKGDLDDQQESLYDYHLASMSFNSSKNEKAGKECLSHLEDVEINLLKGFEKKSYEFLKQQCEMATKESS